MESLDLKHAGLGWLMEAVRDITDEIDFMTPVEFNEKYRYLSSAVTSKPGPMRYDVNPYMIEILNCFSMQSPVREVTLMKGVQLTYTTALVESILLYFIAYIKTLPAMLVTADAELVKMRIENYILPMLNLSGFAHLIQSNDEGNTRKTGKTKDYIQWEGGGFLVPMGAQNANKMRQNSILLLLKDELDAWPAVVGRDGDPDALTDDRTAAYTSQRKILRGSTPLIKQNSKTYKAYLRGDQRKYFVVCKKCGFAQYLEWRGKREDGKEYGFAFETEAGTLVSDSVRYLCKNCNAEYFDHDKLYLFDPKNGAEWRPTAKPVDEFTRSYHLPAFYSPVGFMSWTDCVRRFLEAYDNEAKKVIDIGKYQRFVNNVKGETFELIGDRVRFAHVSSHRRTAYRMGEVPNEYARKYSGSEILFLLCTVDVQEKYLSVAVTGITRGSKTYLIEYIEIKGDDCKEITDQSWQGLQKMIETKTYTADNGRVYGIYGTLIDASYSSDTVKTFCEQYSSLVIPIMGRPDIGKNSQLKEFALFKTQEGKEGAYIKVDLYKDRLAPVLRRMWTEDAGEQSIYHFNAPVDTTDKQLKELTVEYRRSKEDSRGNIAYEWHRPSGSHNELWDLTIYAHAGVDIIAYSICINYYKLETINWDDFWDYMENRLD